MTEGAPIIDESFADAVPARYWHGLDDGRIQCDLCPRFCKLRDGQRGLCFVRARRGDEMVLTTYGRSSGFCIDPIEKKPLNHFLPGTSVLSFGTAGCNLTCTFCQNHDISKSREFDKLQAQATPEMIAEAAVKSGARSVAYTYNDPVIFLEYAVDVAQACRAREVKNVAVSATLIRARDIAMKNGVRYAYTGNVHDKPTQSTYCHHCGEMLIGRDWYELSDWGLQFGGNHLADCKNCGTQLAGVFEETRGDWGRKRAPLHFKRQTA